MSIERRHPAAAERPRLIIAWRAPQVGRFIFPIVAAPIGLPTAMSIERRHPAAAERPRPIYSVACSSGRVVHFPYRCDTPRPTDRDVHRATAPRGSRTPAAGFAPPTRHARPLIFSPYATHRRQISSYKFLLSPPLFPVAAPIALRSARSAIAQRAPGRFAPHSFPLHGGETPTGLFFHLQVLPVLAAPPAPVRYRPRGAAPSAARRPFPHDLRRAVPGIPTVRRCPHPFTPFIPPIARAPRL